MLYPVQHFGGRGTAFKEYIMLPVTNSLLTFFIQNIKILSHLKGGNACHLSSCGDLSLRFDIFVRVLERMFDHETKAMQIWTAVVGMTPSF
jgi:hypothetical protein